MIVIAQVILFLALALIVPLLLVWFPVQVNEFFRGRRNVWNGLVRRKGLLIQRADQQHKQVLNDDDRGVYGNRETVTLMAQILGSTGSWRLNPLELLPGEPPPPPPSLIRSLYPADVVARSERQEEIRAFLRGEKLPLAVARESINVTDRVRKLKHQRSSRTGVS